MRLTIIRTGLVPVCLTALLTACAPRPVQYQPVQQPHPPVPAALVRDVSYPPCALQFNEDLTTCILLYRGLIDDVNARMRALRDVHVAPSL